MVCCCDRDKQGVIRLNKRFHLFESFVMYYEPREFFCRFGNLEKVSILKTLLTRLIVRTFNCSLINNYEVVSVCGSPCEFVICLLASSVCLLCSFAQQ